VFSSILPSYPAVFIGLMFFGAGQGMCDVAMNVEGAAVERALGRTVMPLFHACWSLGTVVGAALGALAVALGLTVAAHLGIIAVAIVIGATVAVRNFQHVDVHGNAHSDAEAASDTPPRSTGSGILERLAIWRDGRILLIGLIVLGAAFAEGTANDWLALAMVDDRGVSQATGALLFGLYTAAMTVGRVAGVPILDRFGRVPVLRASSLLAVIGLLLVILVPVPVVLWIGIVLWGLGSALGFPVGMSAAADNPAKAAAGVAAVATIGYAAFLIGPPLIGVLGQSIGLLNALTVVVVLIALAGLVAPAARPPRIAADDTPIRRPR
jgi:predicted MFS family arabinose efflux permease